MKRFSVTEVIALAIILILIVNIVLLAMHRMPVLLFFIILAIAAILAYWGIPHLKKLEKKR